MVIKKTCFTLVWLVSSVIIAHAQTIVDVNKNINTIKRDTMFIYAEVTMKDLNEAYNGARAILEMKVGDWVRKQHPNDGVELCIVKAKDHFFQLETRRGDFYRAFVYVKKNDILPVSDRNEVAILDVSPAKKESQPFVSQAIIRSEESPSETKIEQPLEITSDEKQMRLVKSFYEIEPYIKKLQSNGKLAKYGKYATMPEEDCHLFVYNKQGNISAILRKSSNKQYNLNTLKEDNIKNYKNCGAIWFQLKK